MLSGRMLQKTWGTKVALHEVNVDVLPGKITTIIGPSGSGKTSLIRVLSLLSPPDSGIVSFEDKVFRFPDKQRKNEAPPWPRITVVFQQLFLFPHLTLRQNIMLPLKVRHANYTDARLCELFEAFEMGKVLDRYPNEASIGERQRAALLRGSGIESRIYPDGRDYVIVGC